MAHRLVLLRHRKVALVVFRAVADRIHRRGIAAVQEELGGLNVLVALTAALHIVHEPAEAHQRLLHFLVPVVPGLLGRGAQVAAPAVGEFLGGVVQAGVLLVGHQVVIDGRFQEVAGGVAFVIAAMRRIPVLKLAALDQCRRGRRRDSA